MISSGSSPLSSLLLLGVLGVPSGVFPLKDLLAGEAGVFLPLLEGFFFPLLLPLLDGFFPLLLPLLEGFFFPLLLSLLEGFFPLLEGFYFFGVLLFLSSDPLLLLLLLDGVPAELFPPTDAALFFLSGVLPGGPIGCGY